jgi:hypothetical protein
MTPLPPEDSAPREDNDLPPAGRLGPSRRQRAGLSSRGRGDPRSFGKKAYRPGRRNGRRFRRCNRVLAGADQGSRPWVRRQPRPRTHRRTGCADRPGSLWPQGLGSRLLPERLRPVPPPVRRFDPALDRRAADRRAQLAITWVAPPLPGALDRSQRLGRDLPRVGLRTIPHRRPRRAQPACKAAPTERT